MKGPRLIKHVLRHARAKVEGYRNLRNISVTSLVVVVLLLLQHIARLLPNTYGMPQLQHEGCHLNLFLCAPKRHESRPVSTYNQAISNIM
jgi:hypothetical protein